MNFLRNLADNRPVIFVILIAVLQPVIAIPFVAGYRIFGGDLVQLRLVIPIAQSVVVIWLIWALGWIRRCGLISRVRNVHLLWFPAIVHFVPSLLYGTVAIEPAWVLFYFVALIATGISEEGFARGIAVSVLWKYGKWGAVLGAAAIFSAGHFTNMFFGEFSPLKWFDIFSATFGFGVLYGALFLRTGSIWPLVVLHVVADYVYLTSGSTGPFMDEPMDIRMHLVVTASYFLFGLFLLLGVKQEDIDALAGEPVPAKT